MKTFFILFALALTCLAFENAGNTLTKLQVIFRHGFRYPINLKWTSDDKCAQSYKANSTLLGNLTNLGRNQMSALGHFLRQRYNKFIGDDPSKIQVNYSNNCYRDYESAQLVLTALFGDKAQIPTVFNETIEGASNSTEYYNWVESLPWSNTLRDQCKKMNKIDKSLSCNNRSEWSDFADQMACEVAEGCTLPSWLNTKVQETFADDNNVVYGTGYTLCSSKKYVQDNGDNLLKWIYGVFKPGNQQMDKNVYLYASHDTNLAIILTRMGVFNSQPVPYGSAVFFEQLNISNQAVIKIFYSNSTYYSPCDMQQLKLPGCDWDCPYDSFVKIVTGSYPCSFAIRSQVLGSTTVLIFFISLWLIY